MTSDALAARISELEADNARLRRLLDRGGAPAELRHRLRGTLGLLRAVIRQSVRTRSEVADYAAHLEDRLDALMRVQAAIDLRGEVDLHTLVADELMSYAAREGERVQLNGPEVVLQPKAAQVLGLVLHELAVNAVEHGGLPASDGRLAVAWRIEPGDPDPSLTLTWTESGTAGASPPARDGFGTEVLTDMIRHELKARTSLERTPHGLRYEAVFPFPPRIGRVVEAA